MDGVMLYNCTLRRPYDVIDKTIATFPKRVDLIIKSGGYQDKILIYLYN
jgi:hypothetical protein